MNDRLTAKALLSNVFPYGEVEKPKHLRLAESCLLVAITSGIVWAASRTSEVINNPLPDTGGAWKALPIEISNARIVAEGYGGEIEVKFDESGNPVYRFTESEDD